VDAGKGGCEGVGVESGLSLGWIEMGGVVRVEFRAHLSRLLRV
jgi:hypothetical protein